MTGSERSVSRRSLLSLVGSSIAIGGLSGCAERLSSSDSTVVTRTPSCSNRNTNAADLYDDWVPYFGGNEFTGSTVTLSTGYVPALRLFPEILSLSQRYMHYGSRTIDRIALNLADVERITTLRPPGETRGMYAVFETPGDHVDREAWISRLTLSQAQGVQVRRLDRARGYKRLRVGLPPLKLIAYDRERIMVFPDAQGPVEADVTTRFERVVGTNRGDRYPYHCYDDDARTLLEGLPSGDLVSARVRSDGETFDESDPRAPSGAVASAFHFRIRWDGRENDPSVSSDEGASTVAESPTERTTPSSKHASPANIAGKTVDPSETIAEIGIRIVYPGNDADLESVRKHVEGSRNATETDAATLGFVEPTIEQSGSVVTVSERRSVASIVD